MIDLNQFCADKHEIRGYLHKPWTRGGYTYATNGHVLVRVPAIPEIPDNEECPDVSRVIAPCLKSVKGKVYATIPVVDEPPQPKDCPDCKDMPEDVECENCWGDGDVDCDECGYSGECPKCDGEGVVGAHCKTCRGDKVIKPAMQFTDIQSASFDSKYIYMLNKLGVKKICAPDKTGAAHFKFDGGDGFLMPVRR